MTDMLYFETHGKTHTMYLPNHERALQIEADIMTNPSGIFPIEIVVGKKTYTLYINPKEWSYWQFLETKSGFNVARQATEMQTPINQ
ncbi:hypothetical protein OZX74_02945 [Bifidobacterium sp. ESL0798]|uniref:hypothetical protein n=1 Tax=Bifidobacterium sp. ESL0798 TaxID=2983235 RepID=UPI0023F61E63|nr:hypothetical protein [Bifidobacterium sp. ESL0798]WEV74508.1 hypothetical protein OZX74_02945 [Bifidobacterium sp. ESL0798]